MKNSFYGKDILSIQDLTRKDIELFIHTAAELKQHPAKNLLEDKIVAHCFFEPSTRTRLSFETATLRLGGKVIGFADSENTSTKKGETLNDTIRVISDYADAIIIRHPQEGSARSAAEISDKPVINAGDAANQHPTQALLDLYTIQECQQKLDGLHIAIAGDLKYGRTVHSLVQACALFNIRLYLIAPESLTLPESLSEHLKTNSIKFSFHRNIEEIINKVDILYMTRIQYERFDNTLKIPQDNSCVLTASMLKKAKPNLKILHPLPRLNEIEPAIDATPYAYYFQQAANGIWMRMALLKLLMTNN